MRIFYAADKSPNAAFKSNIWRNNLLLPLIDLGHDVVEFEYDFQETFQNLDPADPKQKAFIEANRPVVSQELLKQVKEAHAIEPIKLFFSYFYDACVYPWAIDEIKSMGIVTANWYCNSAYQLHLVSEISPHYDWCLFPEKSTIEDYKALGANPLYTQEAANPNVYKHYDLPYEYDVSFIGQAYGERPAFMKFLLEKGVNIKVFGYGWQNWTKRPHDNPIKALLRPMKYKLLGNPIVQLPQNILGPVLSDEDMIKTYSKSKINLGFSSAGETHKTGKRVVHLRLRDFEIPMSGGFYMIEYMQELEEFFEVGKEIVCYQGRDDLISKINHYLTHDDEREAIRKAGYQRAQRDHTWHKRFADAFKQMGLVEI